MTVAEPVPQRPTWSTAQRALVSAIALGAVIIVSILTLSVFSVRSLEAGLVASEDASEQFIAVMREASRAELALLRAGDDDEAVRQRLQLLFRHVDVLRAGVAQQDLDPARAERVATILRTDQQLRAGLDRGLDTRAAAEDLATMERAAKAAADLAETARRSTLRDQAITARSVAAGTLVATVVMLAIMAGLLVSLRRRSLLAHATAYELVLARAEQLEASNRELQRANETKHRFLSMVSHELRTPLTVIRGFAETLARRTHRLTVDQQLHLADAIVRHSLRQQRMVDDLLVLARHADHAPRATPMVVELGDLFDRLVRDLPLRRTQVELPEASPCLVWADPHHVQQILENLLTNADKYGGATTTVRWTSTEDEVTLVVEDDGEGVPTEFIPALFTPFAQADEGDMRVSQGVGLGLAITRLLVDANEGSIRYEDRPGGGARFVVVLPGAGRDHQDEPRFVDRRVRNQGIAARRDGDRSSRRAMDRTAPVAVPADQG